MKTRFAAACLASSLLFSFQPPAWAQAPATDRQQIEGIVETFRTSIINKDQDSFMKLFLHENVTWSGVTTDASLEHLYATRPDPKLPRPRKYFNGNPRTFIEGIAKSRNRKEETFENVRIDSDGEVAQVWFDYSFIDDGKKQNWGKESWQMVRTESGWKIAAVVWSMEFGPPPVLPKKKVG